MFEHHKTHLLPHTLFVRRLVISMLFGLSFLLLSLAIGMCGYHFIAELDWIDAFLESSMLFAGMGPVAQIHTESGKLFAGLYALFCGFALFVPITIMLAPIVHRFLHHFHLDKESKT